MKKLAIVLVAAILIAGGMAAPALAGPYFSVNGGAVWVEDSDISDDDPDVSFEELSYDTGYVVNAALGQAYSNGVRAELELAYRTNDLDDLKLTFFGFPASIPVGGEVTSWGFLANAYYDFPTQSAIRPFIGAGIGAVNVDIDLKVDGVSDSEDDWVFAYQLMAGFGIAVTKDVMFDVQYRFLGTDDPDFDGIEVEYMTHNVMAGLRFNF